VVVPAGTTAIRLVYRHHDQDTGPQVGVVELEPFRRRWTWYSSRSSSGEVLGSL
jgi:hypothetical protein